MKKIKKAAKKYAGKISLSDPIKLNNKGRTKVKLWAKEDFEAGARWMKKQLENK